MPYSVGIDLGTTFAAAAVSDESGTRRVTLSRALLAPSVAFRGDDGRLLTGTSALDAAPDTRALRHGFKRRLGDPTPIILGGAMFSAAALMAAQLRDIVDALTATEGEPPRRIVLTCPAVWGPYRREQFEEVAQLAGVEVAAVVSEPVAAATHLVRDHTLSLGDVVAVYDLGGGTLDTTVLRFGDDGLEILGAPEGVEHLGGLDFDDAMRSIIDEKLDGALCGMDPANADDSALLADADDVCIHIKEELSSHDEVTLDVQTREGARPVTVTRREFEAAIAPSIDLSVESLRRTIASAGVDESDLSMIVLSGGSARIPLVREKIRALGRPVDLASQPKFTVSLGAAIIASREDEAAVALGATTVVTPIVAGPAATTRVGAASAATRLSTWLTTGRVAMIAAILAVVTGLALLPLMMPAASGEQEPAANVPTSSSQPTPSARTASPSATASPAATTPRPTPKPVAPPEPPREDQPPAEKTAVPPPAQEPALAQYDVYDGRAGRGLTTFVGGGTRPDGSYAYEQFTGGSLNQGRITVWNDGQGLGVRWRWNEDAQIYLQGDEIDLTPMANDGAIVFTANPRGGWAQKLEVGADCRYPCGGRIDVTKQLNDQPRHTTVTYAVPVRCLMDPRNAPGGQPLEPAAVDAPFVAWGSGDIEVAFTDIRWVDKPDASSVTLAC